MKNTALLECADDDEEAHRVLMEKVFPRQADVVKTEAAISRLAIANE